MNKKRFLTIGVVLLSIATVLAGVFYFSSFNFTFGVSEPLSVGYAGLFSDPIDCNTVETFGEFNETAIDFSSLYPGDYGKICFAFNSSAGEIIPLSYNIEGNWNETFSSYNIVIPTNTSVNPNKGYAEFTVRPDANGIFEGSISFGRG